MNECALLDAATSLQDVADPEERANETVRIRKGRVMECVGKHEGGQ